MKEKLPMTTQQPLQEGYYRTEDGGWEIIANHEIQGVTPEMIDWWWDHIDSTEHYKLWHPRDHVSFEWVVSPANGHIGAVSRIEEFFNGFPEIPVVVEIRWDDPGEANAEYDHVLLASGTGEVSARLMHEYEAAPFGTRMRSHFHFPPETPEAFIRALYEHNKQEMQYFSTFLPNLHQTQVGE